MQLENRGRGVVAVTISVRIILVDVFELQDKLKYIKKYGAATLVVEEDDSSIPFLALNTNENIRLIVANTYVCIKGIDAPAYAPIVSAEKFIDDCVMISMLE